VDQSMGRVGSCFDNAAIESWHSTLEFELLSRHRFATKAQARREVACFIDWYNRARRHSTCEGKSPLDYEALLAERAVKAAHEADAACNSPLQRLLSLDAPIIRRPLPVGPPSCKGGKGAH
jgi:hypothetical protein